MILPLSKPGHFEVAERGTAAGRGVPHPRGFDINALADGINASGQFDRGRGHGRLSELGRGKVCLRRGGVGNISGAVLQHLCVDP